MPHDFFSAQREDLRRGLSAIDTTLTIVEEITKQYPQFPYDTSRLKSLRAEYTRGLEQLDAGILDVQVTSGTDEVILTTRKWIESVLAEISAGNLDGGKSL
jgi:hypothetical protein